MIIYKSCEICNLSSMDFRFLKSRDGEPLYWLTNPNKTNPLDEQVIFCSAQHCLDWHQTHFDLIHKTQ